MELEDKMFSAITKWQGCCRPEKSFSSSILKAKIILQVLVFVLDTNCLFSSSDLAPWSYTKYAQCQCAATRVKNNCFIYWGTGASHFQCCWPRGKSLSSKTILQVPTLALGYQVLSSDPQSPSFSLSLRFKSLITILLSDIQSRIQHTYTNRVNRLVRYRDDLTENQRETAIKNWQKLDKETQRSSKIRSTDKFMHKWRHKQALQR